MWYGKNDKKKKSSKKEDKEVRLTASYLNKDNDKKIKQ